VPVNGGNSPLLSLAGAVEVDCALDPLDEGLAWHFGDPFAEQRRLSEGVGFADASNRGVIRVSGTDRLSWLQSLVTQDVDHLSPEREVEALLLSPQGHVEHAFFLRDDAEATWLHCEAHDKVALISFLDSMRFLLDVEVSDVSDQWLCLWRPTQYELCERAGFDAAELVERWGPAAGIWAREALRIASGRPRFGLDTDHRTIPHEVGWIGSAVHLSKGCYRGQETVARVHNLGHPPRRLVLLHLDGSADDVLPAHATAITMEGEEVGWIGSSAQHYELGPIALGVVRRTAPLETPLLVGDVSASQEEIVPVDAGNARARETVREFKRQL
jgi:folate-binding protein YgfZ